MYIPGPLGHGIGTAGGVVVVVAGGDQNLRPTGGKSVLQRLNGLLKRVVTVKQVPGEQHEITGLTVAQLHQL